MSTHETNSLTTAKSAHAAAETARSDREQAGFTIWCDFGGVLSPALGRAFDDVSNAVGVPWETLFGAAHLVAQELGHEALQPLELGLISQDEWADRITEKLGSGVSWKTSLRDFDKHYYGQRSIDATLLNELHVFRARGIPVGLLTNSVLEWEAHREVLLQPFEPFDYYLRSHEVRLAKPDPAIYELADTLLGHPGSRRILIDDLAPNCAAATAHGWLAIEHSDTPDTIRQLHALIGD